MSELIGRERELVEVHRVLERSASGLAVLRIEGEAGIGKSALLAATVARAHDAGLLVLEAHPVAAEAKLAFASLGDIIGPLADGDLAWIPEPQRRALDVALVRGSGGGARFAARALSAAVLAMIGRAAEARPLCIAIDDVQWLDAASAAALGYAVRRLGTHRICIVLTQRTDDDGDEINLTVDPLAPERTTTLPLGPLSLSGTYHVLKSRLGMQVSRPVLRRIHQAAGGNPFYVIELARVLEAGGEIAAVSAPLPIPASVHGLVARKVRGQPEAARRAMLIVGLTGAPTDSVVRAVDGAAAERLDELVRAGILDRRDGLLRFAHPLLADMAVAAFDPAERRAMHRRLADAVVEPEARVRHRALALEGPDPAVAHELHAVADALARTSVETACELLELSVGATPDSEAAVRAHRQLSLARLRHRAGDTRGAASLLDELIAAGHGAPARAAALELRAHFHWVIGGADRAVECCVAALSEPDVDPWLRARILVTYARVSMGDHESNRRIAAEALELVERLPAPDPALAVEALTALAGSEVAAGHGIPWSLVDRALALETIEPPSDVSDRMSASVGVWLKYAGELEQARDWLRRTRDTALAEGDEASLPYALSHLPQVELWTGDWEAAAAVAREHLTVAEWTGQQEQRLTAIYSLALVDAHAGRLGSARRLIAQALPEAECADEWNVYQLLATLGFVEVSAGRSEDAVAPLRRAYDIYESAAGADITLVHENLMEALVTVGELDAAASIVDRCVDRALRLSTPMSLVPAFRGLALLRAACGDLEGAARAIGRALVEMDRLPVPFARARTLLAAGMIRRRRNERRAAREALEAAQELFGRLGAACWIDLTARELARIPARRPSAVDGLTPSERQVADLVAQGLTNGEVATHLFVTTKTVEANLTRVYAKLGIRSRSDLARMGHLDPEAPGPKL
jgi:DNA-binding CsgD family transcriptional regulator